MLAHNKKEKKNKKNIAVINHSREVYT